MIRLLLAFMLLCGTCYAEWVHCPVCGNEYKKGEDEKWHGEGKCNTYVDISKQPVPTGVAIASDQGDQWCELSDAPEGKPYNYRTISSARNMCKA